MNHPVSHRLPILALLVLMFSGVSSAATFVVTKTDDTNDGVCDADCSLREAVAAANAATSDDEIVFDVSVFNVPRTIMITPNHLSVSSNGSLIITGPGTALLSINGNDANRVFVTDVGTTLQLTNLTVTNGRSTTPINSEFTGGGIYSRGALALVNAAVIANWAGSGGGGIYHTGGGMLTVSGSDIRNNTLGDGTGGGIYSDGSLNISGSTIRDNYNGGWGGGGILGIGTVSIASSTISGNRAETGAGIRTENAALTITNSTITANSGGSAPGVHINRGVATIYDSIVSNNVASSVFGGGVKNNGGTVNVMRTMLTGNMAANSGCGGVCNGPYDNEQGNFNIANSTISNNSSFQGGGIHNRGFMSISDSAIVGNSSSQTGDGGGIFNDSPQGSLQIYNSTISGNSGRFGGGVYNFQGSVSLTHVTISLNTATSGGGGIRGSGAVSAKNSIIGDNMSANGTSPDVFGPLTSLGFNLIENPNGSTIAGVTLGNIIGQDPQLMPLANYGGLTSTVALLPTSPAIDAANTEGFSAFDQRGFPRSQDGDLDGNNRPDIGAYEWTPTLFVVNKTADTDDQVCDNDCSLREAIAAAYLSEAFDKTVVFDPAVFDLPQTLILTLGQLEVNGTIGVFGPLANNVTISGNNETRIGVVNDGGFLGVRRISFRNGNGIGVPTSGSGGAFLISPGGGLGLVDAEFRNNAAAPSTFGGGAVFNIGKLFALRTRFINNSVHANDPFLSVGGGAIFNRDAISDLIDSLVSDNSVHSEGSGAQASGGGIRNLRSRVVIRRTTISSNKVTRGPNASGLGGGIMNNSGSLTVDSSVIHSNSAVGNGGGINNNVNGVLEISNSTISGNSATGSTGFGGGLISMSSVGEPSSTATLISNSTIFNNTAEQNGGGAFICCTNVSVFSSHSSIIAGNNSPNAPDFSGTLSSLGFNLIEDQSGTNIIGNTTGNILGKDPKLSMLRNNGGPTWTHALLLGSPAIDMGDPTTFPVADQRGIARPIDGDGNNDARSDIGAFEFDPLSDRRVLFDYDGDGRSDLSVRRPGNNVWYLQRGTAGYTAQEFGVAGDKMVPADYDGDGKTDVAVFRPSNGTWYVFMSQSQTFQTFGWGVDGDMPVPTDRDNDGKADLVIYRESSNTWYTRFANATFNQFQFGVAGDKPMLGDFDGDGIGDVALFRPSNNNWYLLKSSLGFFVQTWGQAGDIPLTGDFDGDGATDQAVFRPSTGQWFLSQTTAGFSSQTWGLATDIPVAADYDGDGRTDVAVFRPSNGTWYIVNSTTGILVLPFGQDGDVPTQAAYIN
ncbi:MAG: choice-of-anchor Q domain-containing protein [Pyrinomonadaceae bacterium]